MTTMARFSYSDDPSGRELRRALLVPTAPPARSELTSLLLLVASAVTLLAGLLRVAAG